VPDVDGNYFWQNYVENNLGRADRILLFSVWLFAILEENHQLEGNLMYFECLLDAILGERQIFHIIDCSICGFEEIYYESPTAKQLIGRACSHCNFVQRFE